MNVLLVDDEPLELEQLEFLIQPLFSSWKFYKALDGIQALEIAQKTKINLAFLDIRLPGKSGLELGEALKAQHKDIDLIIVTAYQDFQYAKQSIRLGVSDYITKPITESDLCNTLEKYNKTAHKAPYSNVIKDCLQIIQEKFAEKLTLEDLAAQVHINPSYLSRRFHEEAGTPFSECLMKVRIEKSKEYLVNHADWSISMVAEKTGFSCQQYFSTIFRKITGKTPNEFRKEVK